MEFDFYFQRYGLRSILLAFVIQKSMADFRLIKNNGKKITVDEYDQLHEDCREFLVKDLRFQKNKLTKYISRPIYQAIAACRIS